MKKILIVFVVFLAGYCLASIQSKTPTVALDPIEASVDSLATYLIGARWKCSGDGCSGAEDIGRIADGIREASARHGLSIPLLVGVLMVEDPWLDTTAVSTAGAIGLYQVMPLHRGEWGCEYTLETIDGSICAGSAVLASMIKRYGDERTALLRYNGCRSAKCQAYPTKVSIQSERLGV